MGRQARTTRSFQESVDTAGVLFNTDSQQDSLFERAHTRADMGPLDLTRFRRSACAVRAMSTASD
jgi:hypothetical protein